MVEGHTLAFMHSDGPCQTEGELDETSDFLLFYFLFLFVIGVAHVAPIVASNLILFAIVTKHGEYLLVFFISVNGGDGAQSAIYPSMLEVVFQENDLGTNLYIKFHQRREVAGGKIAFDFTMQASLFARQFRKLLLVDEIHGVTAGGKRDG